MTCMYILPPKKRGNVAIKFFGRGDYNKVVIRLELTIKLKAMDSTKKVIKG